MREYALKDRQGGALMAPRQGGPWALPPFLVFIVITPLEPLNRTNGASGKQRG